MATTALLNVKQRTPFEQTVKAYTSASTVAGDASGFVMIGGGSATAITLSAPVSEGVELTFVATTAQAHTVTSALGFNAGGSGKDVATFGGAIGDTFTVFSYNGYWYVKTSTNVTLG